MSQFRFGHRKIFFHCRELGRSLNFSTGKMSNSKISSRCHGVEIVSYRLEIK